MKKSVVFNVKHLYRRSKQYNINLGTTQGPFEHKQFQKYVLDLETEI